MTRLIPAHAGKTVADDALIAAEDGSSPLTRGKLRSLGSGISSTRLIPAHAGKTGRDEPITTWKRAHPRSRGENNRLRGQR